MNFSKQKLRLFKSQSMMYNKQLKRDKFLAGGFRFARKVWPAKNLPLKFRRYESKEDGVNL